jgi:hypothetical protein
MDQTKGLASYWRIPSNVAQRLRDELRRHTMANDELFEQILARLEESRQRLLELPERVQAMHAEVLALPESERENALLAGRIELTHAINDPWLKALELTRGQPRRPDPRTHGERLEHRPSAQRADLATFA